MLSKADNELLMRTGPGTPMGNHVPPLLGAGHARDELGGPDSPPVRVNVLGENLVAFRDTAGKIGLLDAYCPHRRANLFWGRNEEHGCAASTTAGSSTSTAVHGPAELSRRARRFKTKVTHDGLPDARTRRDRLGLPRPAEDCSRRSRDRALPRAADAAPHHQDASARQLRPGARRRHRLEPRLVSA